MELMKRSPIRFTPLLALMLIHDQKHHTPYDLASENDEIRSLLNPAGLTVESLKQAILVNDPLRVEELISRNPLLLNQQDELVSPFLSSPGH
jgi:hypothetical protein